MTKRPETTQIKLKTKEGKKEITDWLMEEVQSAGFKLAKYMNEGRKMKNWVTTPQNL